MKGLTIAVIDDDESVQNLICEIIERAGYQTLKANNGKTGLALITQSNPDLIVCDITMPVMTGDELFEILQQKESHVGMIPFIFLSGDVNDKERIKRLNKGAALCFEKPINSKLFTAHINSLLSSSKRTSLYINKKLNAIAASLPSTQHNTSEPYKSLLEDWSDYADTIASTINNTKATPINNIITTLDYINFCLLQLDSRRRLVKAKNGENLSWTLIFLVAQAGMENKKVYISDLYVSIHSAKSTINARISSLIECNVLKKINDSTDGRRQHMILNDEFKTAFTTHISKKFKFLQRLQTNGALENINIK